MNLFIDIFGNPFVCYILLILGLYLLLFGIASDEMEMVAVAVVCLGLSIVGIVILGINLASVILFVVGIVLFIAEAETEGSLDGVLAIGGIICTIGGGVFFLQSLSATMSGNEIIIMWATLLTFTIVLAAIFAGVTLKVIEIKKKGATDKFVPEEGDVGVVKSEQLKPLGQVYLKGETWSAECLEEYIPIYKNEKVKVVKVEGVHLIVKPLDTTDLED